MNEHYPQFYHIGMPKTGTTTLQWILQNDPRLFVTRSRFFNTPEWWTEKFPQAANSDQIIVQSEENMVLQAGNFSKFAITLQHIKTVSPDAHIIVTIREQRKLLLSRYKFALRGEQSINCSFEEWLLSGQGMDHLSICMYTTIFQTINAFFPKEKIHFMLFEDLKQNFMDFFHQFYNILNLPVPNPLSKVVINKTITDPELFLIKKFKMDHSGRYTSKFEERFYSKLGRMFAGNINVGDTFKWKTTKLYGNMELDFARENQKLIDMAIIESGKLFKFGYLI